MRATEMLRLAFESMRRARLRTALAALGVSVATGALVSMLAFVLGLQRQAELPFEKLGLLNNIEVRPGRGHEGDPAGAALDDETVEKLSRLPGVACAYPDLRLSGIDVTCGRHSRRTFALGLPRVAFVTGLFGDFLCAGRFFGPGEASEMVVSRGLAKELGFGSPEEALGAAISVRSSGVQRQGDGSFQVAGERIEGTIVGVAEPPGLDSDFGAGGVLVPVDMMRHLPRGALEDQLQRLRDGSAGTGDYPALVVRARTIGDVRRIEKRLKTMGYTTRALIDQLQEIRGYFVFMDVLLFAVGIVALVVAALGILNTLLMAVLERFQEIGLYKALGASNGDIRLIFLAEAGLVGLLGGLGGLALARIVSWGLQFGIDRYMRSQDVSLHLPVFHFTWGLLAGAVLFAVLMSVVSGVLPAGRAARIDPIEALR